MIRTLFNKVLVGFTTSVYNNLIGEMKERELPSMNDKLELEYYTPYLSLQDIFPIHFHKEVSRQPKETELDRYRISFSKTTRKELKAKGLYYRKELKNLTTYQINKKFSEKSRLEIKAFLFDSLYSPEEIEPPPCPSPFFTSPVLDLQLFSSLSPSFFVEEVGICIECAEEELLGEDCLCSNCRQFIYEEKSVLETNYTEIAPENFFKLDLQLFGYPPPYPRFDIEEYSTHFEIWGHSIYGPVYLSSCSIEEGKEGAIKEGKKVFDQTFRGAEAWKGMLSKENI